MINNMTEIIEFNNEEKAMLKFIANDMYENGYGTKMIDVDMAACLTGIGNMNQDRKHDLVFETLSSIMAISVIIDNKSYPLFEELESDGRKIFAKANKAISGRTEDVLDYLYNYLLNPNRHSFIFSGN